MYEVHVLMLCIPFYRHIPDGDLLLKHVGGFMFVDNIVLCNICTYVGKYK